MEELPPNGVKPYREPLQLVFFFVESRKVALARFPAGEEAPIRTHQALRVFQLSKEDVRNSTALPL